MTDDVERDDDASPADVERVSAALRASAPRTAEPDWTKLAADIGGALDVEVRRQRRVRGWAIGGAVLAAAAVAALLVWPMARPRHDARDGERAAAPIDAAPLPDPATEVAFDDELAEELVIPDDLGGITLDDELVDEAAAALERDLGQEADALDDRLLPDGAWIDELSDEDLERAVALLDREAR